MISQHAMPVALAALSVLVAANQAITTTHEIQRGPLIEGVGYVDESVLPGANILVHWTITKRTECPGETSRVWSGESGFQLTEPIQVTALPKGDAMQFDIQTKVPDLAPAGKLDLRVVGSFECPGMAVETFSLGPIAMEVEGAE